MAAVLAVLITATALGQNESNDPASAGDKAEAAERLDFMKRSVTGYEIARGEKQVPLKLLAEPVLRWTNPVSNIPDGVLFLWVDPEGRPQVAAQVFIAAGTKDLWLHEFSSLSEESLKATRDGVTPWKPRKPGIEFKKVAGATSPHPDSAVRRLTQMRNIAQEFKADDDFEGKSRWELRLLAKPVHRYGQENSDIMDGALFTFAHGTDPEVLVMIEARRSGGMYEWYYGLAPMTAYALKVSSKDREIWSAPFRKNPNQPDEPFLVTVYRP
jgi:hypothetical protein